MKVRLLWAFHNIVAHPLLEVFRLVGLPKVGERFHDWTTPYK